MGLRCLIGHDFGEPQIERDRDEQGDEVVVTIREFKECARCGHRRTVSENKEITSLAPPEPDPDPDPAESTTTGATEASGESFENVSAAEDDGIILEDDPDEEPSRGHGEWPAADVEDDQPSAPAVTANGEVEAPAEPTDELRDDHPTEPADPSPDETDSADSPATDDHERLEADTAHPWPSVDEGADEGFDAEASDGESPPDSFADDYSTETTDDTARTGEMVETAPTGSGSGIVSDNPGPSPGAQQRETPGVETEFVCPSCDHRLSSAGSSLRPGDICPECGKGYLAERQSDGSRNK